LHGQKFYTVILRDITERKRADSAIVEWKNRYEAAVQSSNQILYDWDPRTNAVTYGGDLQRILGYSPEELHGGINEWIELVYPDDRTSFNQEIERVIATEDAFHLIYRVCRRDGDIIWVEDRGQFFRDSSGQIKRMVGLIEDITERRRVEELIKQINVELEQRVKQRTAALAAKSRELEVFAYSVAHDLKAPLRGIDGYSRLLLEDYADKLDDEGRGFLHNIHASTEQMSQLIEDLLAYSRLERREMKPGSIELGPLIETLVEQKRHELTDRPIDFVLNINGGRVVADARGLTQALRNYLDNAVKFTRDAPAPRIEVGARESDRDCCVWVRDNGVGFDMRYHDKIFEIFQRLHLDEEYNGTGVGLAIVRKAMERIGGRAWAESEPGRGATFYLEIPK
jgi:PAS domain S-box-containing protein